MLQEVLLDQFLASLPPGQLEGVISRVANRELAPSEALTELGVQSEASLRYG
jgi:hypothetical protein